MMFQQAALENLDQYFTPLSGRAEKCVYFYRFACVSEKLTVFFKRYYEISRRCGVIIDGRIPNPDPQQLAYFSEMMGTQFQPDQAFLSQRLAKWLPRMSPAQCDRVARAMAATLEDMRQQGKTESILRNAYIKYMCWLYYKFERILNQLGAEELPKILYDGAMSNYELQLLVVLSRAGADIAVLDRGKEGYYSDMDPSGDWSRAYQEHGAAPLTPDYNIKQIQREIARDMERDRLYGPPPSVSPCTNAWMVQPELKQLLTGAPARGQDRRFFYNSFIAQYGVEDKLTFSGDLFALYKGLKSAGRRVHVVSGGIPVPTPEEVSAIRRHNYTDVEQMAAGLVQNIQCPGGGELQKLMRKAFLDIVLAEEGQVGAGISKRTNQAVYLLCWLKRYRKELFEGWKLPEVSVFILFGACASAPEAAFLRLLAKLPVDVVLLQPELERESCLHDPGLLELRWENSLPLAAFPVEGAQVRVSTAAYEAERELDSLMYRDSGLYRDRQYAKAEAVTLRVMYEEIFLLWDQELKYRPSFQVTDDTVSLPVLLEKICGVKDRDVGQYWLDIKKLITPDTLVVSRIPWLDPLAPNPMKAAATQFLKNGRLLRQKIKNHKDYPYSILRPEIQEYLLDKLQLLLDQRTIKGTYQNGTEYTIIVAVLNLGKEPLRLIQKLDFTKKNPKVIVVNTTEQVLSLEESILLAYLNLVGFDIIFFIPTGYQCIERYFQHPFANEQQLGEYIYDLPPPDFNRIQDRGRNPIRRLFGRS